MSYSLINPVAYTFSSVSEIFLISFIILTFASREILLPAHFHFPYIFSVARRREAFLKFKRLIRISGIQVDKDTLPAKIVISPVRPNYRHPILHPSRNPNHIFP